ncbi:MAG: hypothetical protein Q4E22_02470, partial [Coriobacteriia bacterium]|nr:hypothetical protein [Coriobacteriia bacterium]
MNSRSSKYPKKSSSRRGSFSFLALILIAISLIAVIAIMAYLFFVKLPQENAAIQKPNYELLQLNQFTINEPHIDQQLMQPSE